MGNVQCAMYNEGMKNTQLKTIFGWATVVCTIITAIVLLTAIWWFSPDDSELAGRMIATSITFSAFSFVLFIVASFWKK